MTDVDKFVDAIVSDAKKYNRGVPDMYIIYRTSPPFNYIVGEPMAIVKTEEGLRAKLLYAQKNTDAKFGITACAYWFDDNETLA